MESDKPLTKQEIMELINLAITRNDIKTITKKIETDRANFESKITFAWGLGIGAIICLIIWMISGVI